MSLILSLYQVCMKDDVIPLPETLRLPTVEVQKILSISLPPEGRSFTRGVLYFRISQC